MQCANVLLVLTGSPEILAAITFESTKSPEFERLISSNLFLLERIGVSFFVAFSGIFHTTGRVPRRDSLK